MGISAKQLDVNTRHINELADQIRYNTDCEVLSLIIDEHLDALRDLLSDTIEEQLALSSFLPIASPPSPTPTSIVAWISKLITATATPQLKAQIKYTKKLIGLAAAIANVVSAIKQAQDSIRSCAIGLEGLVLEKLERAITAEIAESLNKIGAGQTSILTLIDPGNSIPPIDTTSAESFTQTVDASLAAIEIQVVTHSEAPLPA